MIVKNLITNYQKDHVDRVDLLLYPHGQGNLYLGFLSHSSSLDTNMCQLSGKIGRLKYVHVLYQDKIIETIYILEEYEFPDRIDLLYIADLYEKTESGEFNKIIENKKVAKIFA